MKVFAAPILLVLLTLLINPFCINAQEENSTVVTHGNRYISLKVKSIDKYNSRIEHQQKHLLNKLKRKETHFAHKLKNSDSLAYARYKLQSSPSYDSISKLSKSDTGITAASFSKQKNTSVDSLRGVQSFVQSKSGLSTNAPQAQGTNSDLNSLQGKMNFHNYINQLITQRTNNLKNLAGSESNVPGLKGIEKQVFYGKSKMSVYKEMEEDPTKAEDKAMEYLQGTSSFDKYMKNAIQGEAGSMQALAADGAGASELESMGYQTKRQMQKNLQQQFGNNLGAVALQMSSQVNDFQKNVTGVTDNIKESKQSLTSIKHIDKPSFSVNPMRGLPFWKRIEKQYNWQTTRASTNGKQPAIIEPSAMFGFKHTPKLTYGIGAATDIGLGQSWQNIHLSFQGIGLRSFVSWEWQYGLGAYAGYERMYNKFVFTKKVQTQSADVPINAHSTTSYNESVLLGVTKKYCINNKYNGQIQLLYDIWWQEKGLRSPIILRFATIKN